MIIDDISLVNMNDSLREQFAAKGEGLDFCKMIIHPFDEKLSVIAKYSPQSRYYTLKAGKAELSTDPAGFYYGVSPCLDTNQIMKQISCLEINTCDGLMNYIDKTDGWFSVHEDQRGYLKPLAAYIVVCMASHFGIRIETDSNEYERIKNILLAKGYSKSGVGLVLAYDDSIAGHPFMTIKGFPMREVLDSLDGISYEKVNIPTKKGEDGQPKDNLAIWRRTNGNCGISIRDVYRQQKNLELIRGSVFYSGVLLMPRELKLQTDSYENDKIESLLIHFERSTYGTVCAMDMNLTEHPFLIGNIKAKIVEMLCHDDEAKKRLEKETRIGADAGCMVRALNKYLSSCFNVNQIGVSGNIITHEGMLLLGQRRKSNIDAGKLYPGVNGNAEVADRDVSFYSQSVYEDSPTIHLEDDRIDFFGEIGREAYAEAKLDLSRQEWICRGVVISGNMPKGSVCREEYCESFRRLHFNLIFEHNVDKTLQEIAGLGKRAAEAFETMCYRGIKVICAKNRLGLLCKCLKRWAIGIINHKDFVESVSALIAGVWAISQAFYGQAASKIEYISIAIAMPLAVLIVVYKFACIIQVAFRFCCDYFSRKIQFVRIYSSMSYNEVNKRVQKAMGKRNDERASFHPAAYACLWSFVISRIHEAFSSEDR